MISVLTSTARDGWHHFVTRDESWFFVTHTARRMWTLTRADVATKLKHDIHMKKFMFTVMWNSLGFHVVDQLPTRAKMNGGESTTNIFEPLEQKMFLAGRRSHEKRLTLHLDNCSIYMSGATEVYINEHIMIRLKHPPYSPNLAPGDFYLFRTVKEKLKSIQMIDEEHLFDRLQGLLNGSCHQEWDKDFDTWINRFMIVSSGDGGDIS
jgi:histone-lysine N-methyltransferase SETMAR